jgi:hypothetical protein
MKKGLAVVTALIALGIHSVAPPAAGTAPNEAKEREFRAFLERVQAAQMEFVRGRPDAFKALYSRRPDASIFGGFGAGDQGWSAIGPRLDWGSAQYSEGSRAHEVLATVLEGDLGYVVQIERIRYKHPGRGTDAEIALRATMILRREAEGWRIVHRHADSQMERQPPK